MTSTNARPSRLRGRLALQPLRVGADAPLARAVPHPRVRGGRRARVRAARPVGGPAVHVPRDGREDQLCRAPPRTTSSSRSPTASSASCRKCPNVDWVRSYSKPGESLVFFALKDSAPPAAAADAFYQVRKKIGDIRNQFPAGIQGPFFNDEFGDTYTNIYALTGDGFGYRELKEFGDKVRAELLRVPGVAKVDFIGEQDEKVFIELSNAKLATLGVEPAQIIETLARQNAVAPSGVVRHGDRSHLRAARPARSTTSTRSATSRSAPTTASSAWATSRRSRAATSTRRSRRCAGRARKRSASASRWSRAAT